MLAKVSLRYGRHLSLLLLISCLNTRNSFEGDVKKDEGSGSAAFQAAREVIVAKCASCHTFDHSKFANWGEAAFVSNNYVVPGNPNASVFYTRIRNADSPNGIKNMPPAPDDLTAEQIQIIKTWILGINTTNSLAIKNEMFDDLTPGELLDNWLWQWEEESFDP